MQIYAIFINEQTFIKRKKRKSTIFTPFDFLLFSVIPLRFERRTHALEGFIQKDGYLIAYQVNIYIFAFGKDTH